jgi:hypothetical protein
VMSQNFTNCHTKIRHVDAFAMLMHTWLSMSGPGDGTAVQQQPGSAKIHANICPCSWGLCCK